MTHAGAMTIDVEDYYHVHAFKHAIDRADWASMPSRVEENTHRMLDLFDDVGAKATFFTLGCVAAEHPGIVKRIVADGHELASHGWDHWAVFDQDREAFFGRCCHGARCPGRYRFDAGQWISRRELFNR